MSETLYDQIPGLREAVERETEDRELDFADAPDFIAGIEVRPLTLRLFLLLHGLQSPFVSGTLEPPTEGHIRETLWIISAAYARAIQRRDALEFLSPLLARWTLTRARRRFYRRAGRLDYRTAVTALLDYFRHAFEDGLGGRSTGGPLPYGWPAAYVAALAAEFHWRETDLLDLPMRRFFQYLRCLRHQREPKAIFFNPSDAVRTHWLNDMEDYRLSLFSPN